MVERKSTISRKIHNLEITVYDIKGHCPVYRIGDAFYLDEGYILNTKKSCDICMHSLASILPYYNAIKHGINPQVMGLAGLEDSSAHIQCLDPCAYTGGGTVTFKLIRRDTSK